MAPAEFQLDRLEQRTLLSVAPSITTVADAKPHAATVLAASSGAWATPVITKADRQNVLNHWIGSNRRDLQAKLSAGKLGAFDGALLSYMRSRTGNNFFWKTSEVAGIKDFLNANFATAPTLSNADHIVAHQFPNGNSANFDVQLGSKINWTTTTSNPDFTYTLNWHEYWIDLAQAQVLSGSDKYGNELVAQLASWSAQAPTPADPNGWAAQGTLWQPFSAAQRAGNWTWAYQMVLGSASWTAAANTLMLVELYKHADFLRRVTPYALDTNRALFEAQGLLDIAHLVPEFDQSADWRRYGHKLLFGAMDAQIYPDGGHAEASPGYGENVILALLEQYWLDRKTGQETQWTSERLDRLRDAAKAQLQLLTPDGKQPAISDTYRTTVGPFWDRPRVILNDAADFPAAKPRLHDVWLFGTGTSSTMLGAAIYPALPNRGNSYSMPQSGYYVMRSGKDSDARQITFDAGPTGGHGHFDLLSFELFGYGHPLISDPGLYKYDNSARRNWAVSTPAHNTISVDNKSHATISGIDSSAIWSSGISRVAGGYQITATHSGYASLAGSPAVLRSIWYDGNGTMLIVDRGSSSSAHAFATSFLLPGTNNSRDLGAGWIRTNNTRGNVMIRSLLDRGQAAHRQTTIPGTSDNIFVSNDPDGGIANDATRYYVDQNTTYAQFVTLVTAYSGTTAPNVTAKVIAGARGGTSVQIYRNGNAAEVVPFFTRPAADFRGSAPVAGANDLTYDASGRLHMVFNDRSEKDLKYATRDASGKWSLVQTVDPGFEAGGYPSLALDSFGKPAVAYFDGSAGDLKYAYLVGGAWQVDTVESAGSTGLYPSLVFNRAGAAMIAYYNRSKGELRLATQYGTGWKITTIDSAGDVGRCTSATLDPNNPNHLAVAYDDSRTGAKKFAIQSDAGWSISTVDSTMPRGGGYTSLVYEPLPSSDDTYHATMSYYDSSSSALKFARFNGRSWSTSFVATRGVQGLYTSLYYDAANRPNILFFDKTHTKAYRATTTGTGWTMQFLGTGGREMQTARSGDGTIAYTNLDADGIRVGFLTL